MNGIARHATAVGLFVCWAFFIWFDSTEPRWVGSFFVIALYLATCIFLRRLEVRQQSLSIAFLFPAALLSLRLINELWQTLVGAVVQSPAVFHDLISLDVATDLLYVLFATLGAAAISYYPLSKLFPRWYWVIPSVVGTLELYRRFDKLLAYEGEVAPIVVIVVRFTCLTLVMPGMLMALHSLKLQILRKQFPRGANSS